MAKWDSAPEVATTARGWASAPEVTTQSEAPKQPGLLSRMGGAVVDAAVPPLVWAGRQLDRVMTAPLRAGVTEIQKRQADRGEAPNVVERYSRYLPGQLGTKGLGRFNPVDDIKDLAAGGLAATKQFGRDPDNTESSKTIAEREGVPGTALSDVAPGLYSESGSGLRLKKGGLLDPTASGVAGMAAEMAVPIPPAGKALSLLKPALGPGMRMAEKGVEGVAKVADAATGTKLGTGALGATKTVAKATAGAFTGAKEGFGKVFKAKQADDFGESVKTAMANGIDPKILPEAVEFGPSSIVSRTARVQAEGITGQPLLERHQAGLDQVRDAVRADIEKIGGGAPLTKPDAGAVLRDGFNAGVDRAFDAVNTSHKSIIKEAPGLRLSESAVQKIAPKLEELEKWATQKAENGLTNTAKGQGQQILNAIGAFRRKGESYAGAYEALQEIGDVAFKSKNTMADIPPDISRFRKLYGDISEAMTGTVDDAFGADKGKALRESNQAMHKIYGDKSLLGKLGQESTSDEQLFQSIIEHGDTKRIAALKPYLEPEQLAALKGAFLNNMIKESADGSFPFKSLHNAIRGKGTVASALFEPDELKNLNALIKLGDKFGSAIMSQSGTGASNAIRESVKEVGNSIADNAVSGGLKDRARAIGFDVNNPLKAAAQSPGMPPVMGLGPRILGGKSGLNIPDWRKRALRGYGAQQQEEEEP